MTPPSAPAPYRSPVAPRTTSTRSTAAIGMRFQYTQLPNGSFSGTPSASTSVRLDPDPDTPRSVTPCVVGLATRDDERRNKVKPGVERSASSSAPAAMLLNSADVSTVELAALGSRSAPRVAVTTTESAKLVGRSTTRTGPAPATVTVADSNPSEDTCRLVAVTLASKLPSVSVVTVLERPSLDFTLTEAPGMTAPEISTTVPVVVVGAGCWAAAGSPIGRAAGVCKIRPGCWIIKVGSTTNPWCQNPIEVCSKAPIRAFRNCACCSRPDA